MKNLKLKIRNIIIKFTLRSIFQNKDNNRSLYNQKENEALTAEFYACQALNLVNNQLETFEKIKQYVTKMDEITSEEEQRKRAADTYIKFREAMLIDNDCKLLKGVDEYITDFIS